MYVYLPIKNTQSVPISSKIVSLYPDHGEVYAA